MENDAIEPVTDQAEAETPMVTKGLPIRWRWTILVGFAVIATVGMLFLVIIDIEHDAWLESQAEQAKVHVDRLADEVKLHMLSGSSTETELVVSNFLEKVPAVLGVQLEYAPSKDRRDRRYFGKDGGRSAALPQLPDYKQVQRLEGEGLWYARTVVYSGTTVGKLGVRFSEEAWEKLAWRLASKMLTAAIVVVILSSLLVYWIAGRMSKPFEMMAVAARKVAEGDYHIRLPVRGHDEIAYAVSQFNEMVGELQHKEELRNVFGRYLNPKLVSDVFNNAEAQVENHRQEVTVLFADMVRFTSFSESTDIENVVSVLNRHFEVFHCIIAYYGGHVDKYIGDALMAVFNHPVDDPSHARHAAEAGLAMAMACKRLGVQRDNGEPITFRIGLNCGQAIVCNLGAAKRLEYTVIGDTVNVASRMVSVGAGDELIMPHTSFSRLGQGFSYDSIGKLEIRGVSQAMECGIVRASSRAVQQNIQHAVDLAFELAIPEDVRQIAGDV